MRRGVMNIQYQMPFDAERELNRAEVAGLNVGDHVILNSRTVDYPRQTYDAWVVQVTEHHITMRIKVRQDTIEIDIPYGEAIEHNVSFNLFDVGKYEHYWLPSEGLRGGL